jgi:hypothetical protein
MTYMPEVQSELAYRTPSLGEQRPLPENTEHASKLDPAHEQDRAYGRNVGFPEGGCSADSKQKGNS